MPCRDFEASAHLLEDYLSGKLAEPAAPELRAHLAVCATCREEVESARECGVLLRSAFAPAAEPGGAFWFRVLAGIRASAPQGDFWSTLETLARRLAWSAALTSILLAGYVVTSDSPREPAAAQLETFPEPAPQPADSNEALVALVENGR